MLIPNVNEVEKSLGEFAEIMEADEVLLFEKSTFLIIAHAQRTEHRDVHRFEKISNIIKQFKLSCIKLAAQFTVSTYFEFKMQLAKQDLFYFQVHGGAKLKIFCLSGCFYQPYVLVRGDAPIDVLDAPNATEYSSGQETF